MTDTSMPGGNGIALQEAPSWAYAFDPVALTPIATFPGAASMAGLNGGPLGGLRNRVINGAFQINQRNYGGPSLAAGVYGHDRWKGGASGCSYTASGATVDSVVTITAGSLVQPIESYNLGPALVATPYTLSWQGSALGRMYTGSPPAYAASPITANLLVTGNQVIEFTNGTLSDVQLEVGTLASPFERRLIGTEFMLCQRYFQQYIADSFAILQGYQAAGQPVVATFALPPMRTPSPTGAIIGTYTFVNTSAITIAVGGNGISGPAGLIVQLRATATALGAVSATTPNGGGFSVSAEL